MNSIVIIPLKSYKGKDIISKFNIKILKSEFNKLEKDSICDIFHIKNISTKRLKGRIGVLEKKYLDEIDTKVLKMFDIKIKDEI